MNPHRHPPAHAVIRLLVAVFVCLLIGACGHHVQMKEYPIVPEPTYMVHKGRTFTLKSSTRLCFENLGRNTPTAKYISTQLRKMHLHPYYSATPTKDCLTFTLNDTINTELDDEGYLLQVRPEGILVSANSEAGLLYAFQTLVQMLPEDMRHVRYSRITLPECTILDRPRCRWRGSHLDVCHQFLTVAQVQRHLDLMAAYKLNKLVLQLSNDQVWRVELPHYPELSDQTGTTGGLSYATRSAKMAVTGHYSPSDIADIVAYAAGRGIEVIPAIELPTRCDALLSTYPHLLCKGTEILKQTGIPSADAWPPLAQLCAGDDSMLTFLCGLLDELASFFPSEYVHLGGGHAAYDAWERCPHCQARIRELGLKGEAGLQGWLIGQLADSLARKGKRIMVWDDLLACGPLPTDAMVVSIGGAPADLQPSLLQENLIAAPPEYCLLSSSQHPKVGLADNDSVLQTEPFPQYLPLRKAYQFDPGGTTPLGGLALLWTDYVADHSQAEQLLLPRLCALAEALWSQPENRNWNSFRHRIGWHRRWLQGGGYNCYPGSFQPTVVKEPDGEGLMVTIHTEVEDSYVYYTLDGSDPTPESPIYQHPLHVPHGTLLRTLTLFGGVQQEQIYDFRL